MKSERKGHWKGSALVRNSNCSGIKYLQILLLGDLWILNFPQSIPPTQSQNSASESSSAEWGTKQHLKQSLFTNKPAAVRGKASQGVSQETEGVRKGKWVQKRKGGKIITLIMSPP